MLNFDYSNKTRIVFGKGTETQVAPWSSPTPKRFFSTTAGEASKRRPLRPGSRLPAGIGRFLCGAGSVQPNPRLSLIHQGIELCRREGIGFILAVGGGSVIDSAKAIAMGVPYDGRRVGFLRNRQAYRDCPAGCHHFDSARHRQRSQRRNVVTNEEAQLKLPYGDVILRPVFSIMNPELYFTLPENQVANGSAT